MYENYEGYQNNYAISFKDLERINMANKMENFEDK